MSYIDELNKKISIEIDRSRSPVDEIIFSLIDQYGFSYRCVELDSYDCPVRGFTYESKSEITSTPEFLKEIKTLNRKAKDLGMEVFFYNVKIHGVNSKFSMIYDDFMRLYGSNRYLNKGRFVRLTIEIRAIYPD